MLMYFYIYSSDITDMLSDNFHLSRAIAPDCDTEANYWMTVICTRYLTRVFEVHAIISFSKGLPLIVF